MKKLLSALLFVFIFIKPVFADGEKTIWEYSKDDLVNNSLFGNDSFFISKKQEMIDRELEKLLNIKLVPVSLEECLKLAVSNNYEIKEKKETVKSNKWNLRNAYSRFLPDFQYDYILQRLSGVYVVGGIVPLSVNETPIQSTFEVSWNAFDKGRDFFLTSQRRSLYKASVLNQKFTREQVILNTSKCYYELLRNKAEVDIYATNVIDRKTQYDLTKVRYDVGVGTKFDIYRAEAELAKAKQQYITAFNAIRITQAKLANLTGIDVLVPLYPKDNIIQERKLSDTETDTLIQWSRSSRKDLLAIKKQIDALKAERSSNYLDFVPDVNLNYQYAHNGTEKLGLYPSHSFTVTAIAPLGKKLGIDTLTKIKAQSAAIKSAEFNLEQKTRNVAQDIITSKQNSASAFERIESSKKEVFAAEKSLENSMVLMETGLASFIDVIQAQALKVNAQVGLAENITDYNIAQVQILFDAGIISIDGVLNGINKTPQTP